MWRSFPARISEMLGIVCILGLTAVAWADGTRSGSHTITKSDHCDPGRLQGVYHDLKDANYKIVNVSPTYGLTITPPGPSSRYYVEGVGKDWIVPPQNVGPVNDSCFVVDIAFQVLHKPAPPPGNVTAEWVLTQLIEIPWVASCTPDRVGTDECGQAGAYPNRSSAEMVYALTFGSWSNAGNVWVKIADADTDIEAKLAPNEAKPAPVPDNASHSTIYFVIGGVTLVCAVATLFRMMFVRLTRPKPTPPPLLADDDEIGSPSIASAALWLPSATAPSKDEQDGFRQF